MKKYANKTVTVTARDLSVDGHGICALPDEGKIIFVPGLIPGETAEVSVTKETSSYCTGKIKKLLSLSEYRKEPECRSFPVCGGCSLQHISYEGQLVYKKKHVEACLQRIGGFADIEADDVLPSPSEWKYRNKLAFPVQALKDGGFISGCYESGSHKIVDAAGCLLHSEKMMNVTKKMTAFMESEKISGYDEASGKGCVRHLTVRETESGKMLAGFVVNDRSFPMEKAKKALADWADSVVLNINTSKSNIILGNETEVVAGSGTVSETILGKHFTVSVNTFLQVNHRQTENLYSLALSYSDLKKTDVLADLYCGIGTISICAADKVKKVYGIEIVPESIKNACINSESNGISNAEFICADAGEGFRSVLSKEAHIDCITVDPPRKGLSEEAVKGILDSEAERVVYISCGPDTLARDLKMLCERDYKIEKVSPVDMFPQTTHVETVVLLSRKKVDGHVNIDLTECHCKQN